MSSIVIILFMLMENVYIRYKAVVQNHSLIRNGGNNCVEKEHYLNQRYREALKLEMKED